MLTDQNRNTYVVGSRHFPGPTSTPLSDVFVAKLDPTGATVFIATFSGKGSDEGHAIALDAAGDILVGGTTSSPDFPIRNALQPQRSSFGSTGFLMKLSPDGSQLVYSTYFGGTTGNSSVNAIAADSAGNVYLAGNTSSADFGTTPGMPAGQVRVLGPSATTAAFVAKVNPAGDHVLYAGRISGGAVACGAGSSCFLSSRYISADGIGLDAAGNAYMAGYANVMDLPTTPGALVPLGIGGWVARVNSAGNKLDYLTYLGIANYVIAPYANPGNTVSGLAVDAVGNVYLAGRTSDPRFPATAGAYQSKYNGPSQPAPYPVPPSDAFVAKLNPLGTAMVYATFLGGLADDVATAIAIDANGTAYVAGRTQSSDFPVTTGTSKGTDFIAVANPAGTSLTYSARFPGGSISQAIAADTDGRVRAASPTGLIYALTLTQPLSTRLFGTVNAAGGMLVSCNRNS